MKWLKYISPFTGTLKIGEKGKMKFRDDFVWGAATSSYQIEGGQNEGGKGAHLWDEYVKEENGKVFENQRGDVSCDHYHRYKEDVKLMKELGIKAYRFSIDWTRIIPEGIGAINEEGIAFYNSLIDELVANDIEPYLTLFHWELPMELYKRGGWMNPDMPEWFANYARVIAERFHMGCCNKCCKFPQIMRGS